jgi:hypothetical protein
MLGGIAFEHIQLKSIHCDLFSLTSTKGAMCTEAMLMSHPGAR